MSDFKVRPKQNVKFKSGDKQYKGEVISSVRQNDKTTTVTIKAEAGGVYIVDEDAVLEVLKVKQVETK